MNTRLLSSLVFLWLCACAKVGPETSEPPAKDIAETQTENPTVSTETATVYTTAQGTDLRLSETGKETFGAARQPLETEVAVFVNPEKQFQSLLGIGGAITDASAEVFAQLPPEKQDMLLSAYFDADGIGYTLLRTPIHSCDFSSGSFTYVEEGDEDLSTFSIEHDRQYRLPMIQRAVKHAQNVGNGMTFYASPWSPPAYMKTNGDMLQGGKLKPEYYQTWADYFVKFVEAYEAEGLPVWGVTIQNEPMATQRWESCIYTAEEERDFLKNHLGPAFEQAGMGDKNIVVWDHNRDLITHRGNTIFEDPEAAQYAWGIGFHWYETWTGAQPNFESLDRLQESFPGKKLLFTEGCNEAFDPAKYEHWPNAERYGRSMINDFNQGTVGWTDWNILLDHKGGPNHVGNYCFAPVHANTETGELIFTPTYYYIGHFSKFVLPGARRVSTVPSRTTLLATTFANEGGNTATVIMNPEDEAIKYHLIVGERSVALEIPARAMQTVVY